MTCTDNAMDRLREPSSIRHRTTRLRRGGRRERRRCSGRRHAGVQLAAAHGQAEQTTQHVVVGYTEPNFVGPCDGSLGDLTVEGDQVFHITDTGRTYAFNFALNGSFVFDPYQAGLPTIAGRLIWTGHDIANYSQLKDLRVTDVVNSIGFVDGKPVPVLIRAITLYSPNGEMTVKLDSIRCVNFPTE